MSDDIENYLIPRLLDAPAMALWIESDTAILGLSGLYIGLMTGSLHHLFVAASTSFILAHYYARMKSSGGRGMIPRLVYWYLPGTKKAQPISPLVREYRG